MLSSTGQPLPLDVEGDIPYIVSDGNWQTLHGDHSLIAQETGVMIEDGGHVSLDLDPYPPAAAAKFVEVDGKSVRVDELKGHPGILFQAPMGP